MWLVFICAAVVILSNYGFYLAGRKTGRAEHESRLSKEAHKALLQAKAVRERMRRDPDFARRMRAAYRR